jgi:hypothetical protein
MNIHFKNIKAISKIHQIHAMDGLWIFFFNSSLFNQKNDNIIVPVIPE